MRDKKPDDIEFRIFKGTESDGQEIINPELICTTKDLGSALEFLNNQVKNSSHNRAYKMFYFSKFVNKDDEWVYDEEFGMKHVGGPKTAGELLEDLGLE